MSRISKIRYTDTFQNTYSMKKLKMPTKSILRMDDYDEFQPCFLSDTEEFYSLNTPTPSADIWKKFELLPTPPRSPKREPYSDFSLDESTDISSLLDDDDIFLNPNDLALPFPDPPPPFHRNLNSNLIQDCMWSGNHSKNGVIESTKSKIHHNHPEGSCGGEEICTQVFPYPINNNRLPNLGTETPSDSEDEEVDVVSTGDEKTVSQGVQVDHKSSLNLLKHLSPKSSPVKNRTCVQQEKVEPKSKLCVKVKIEPQESVPNSDCSAISVHNYSLPYSHGIKRTRTSQVIQPIVSHKRIKREQTEPVLKSVAKKLKSSVVEDLSDCEENCEGRRTLHNVLERRRRNDLKDSFYVLRDQVPELDSKEKAPKVLILRKASDYVHSLRRTDSRYTRELNQLKNRNEMLQKKLAQLQEEAANTDSDEEYCFGD